MGYWFLIMNYRIVSYWLLPTTNCYLQFGVTLGKELSLIISYQLLVIGYYQQLIVICSLMLTLSERLSLIIGK